MKIKIFITLLLTFIYSDTQFTDSTKNSDGIDPSFRLEGDIFEQLMTESKLIFAEAVLADMNQDTMYAHYYFDKLFTSIYQLVQFNDDAPDFVNQKYDDYYSTVIDYYENKTVSIDYSKTDFSPAVLKDILSKDEDAKKIDDIDKLGDSFPPIDPIELSDGGLKIDIVHYEKEVKQELNKLLRYGKRYIQQCLNREAKFKEIILPILDKEGLPLELFYVAMAESGLKTTARSYAKAVGTWQFIEPTANIYFGDKKGDFKNDYFVDERRDIIKSTKAAAKYLKTLYREFGEWDFALAAYNGGEGRLRNHIRYGRELGYGEPPYEFWDLVPNNKHPGSGLPKETRQYVPKILALLCISKNPEKYGFKVNSDPMYEWNVIDIDKTVTLEDIEKCSGIDVDILREYNPELVSKQPTYVKVDEGNVYKFNMPINCDQKFDSLFALIKPRDAEGIEFVKHRVKYGENLTLIAKKYGSTVTDICDVNNLNRKKHIYKNQVLTVPVGSSYKKGKLNVPKKIVYKVKRGDTLSGIAVKHRVKVRSIKKWNNLKNDRIRIGQKLIIWK